jgi:hypothetical protein
MTAPQQGSGAESDAEASDHRPDSSAHNGSVIPTVHIREVRQGHMPGERFVRIHGPFHETFRETGSDTLVAREQVFTPRNRSGKVLAEARRILFGRPLATADLIHERLSKTKALAVFSSDALSSSAYATEEILRILVLAGAAALTLTLPVALAIGLLLAIVAISYRQTIKAYPHGGGSYIVSKDNLGNGPALVAAAALLTDYVLTVAVSISAGVFALTSAAPMLHDYKVAIAVGFIALTTIVNLRGVSESGAIFAAPMVIILIPIPVWLLLRINGHYLRVAEQIALDPKLDKMPAYPEPILIVPVPGLNRVVARTIGYARALSKNVTAIHVTDDLEAADELRRAWKSWETDVPLVILESKYRALASPLMHYLDAVAKKNPSAPITVVLAEYVPRRWWEWPLHNQTALRLKGALFFRPNTCVVDVPYHLVR